MTEKCYINLVDDESYTKNAKIKPRYTEREIKTTYLEYESKEYNKNSIKINDIIEKRGKEKLRENFASGG